MLRRSQALRSLTAGSRVTVEGSGISFAYASGDCVIDQMSFAVVGGEMLAVTGASGSGKSTLLYLTGGLLRPGRGSIRLADGSDLAAMSDANRSRRRASYFGFVFQDASLDAHRTVMDNVCEGALYAGLSRPDARNRATGLLEQMGVALRTGHRPGEISGGQAQRVALCRALLPGPRVILADEPTGNLDDGASDLVTSVLRRFCDDGGSVIVASHDRRVVDQCDRSLEIH
jgi:ABC-type lipoprotein export system ATPase subunit